MHTNRSAWPQPGRRRGEAQAIRLLLIATHNQGKLREYRQLLAGLPFAITSLAEQGIEAAVPEVGKTFAENAALKAQAYAALSRSLTMADDSGLEVAALGGEPGVQSARYAGEEASDAERIALLLSRLRDVPWEERRARFRCVIAIAEPQGNVRLAEGEVGGFITFAPKGREGFGYDPVFYLPELGRTMAELAPEEKNRISHRARAAQAARELLATCYS